MIVKWGVKKLWGKFRILVLEMFWNLKRRQQMLDNIQKFSSDLLKNCYLK